MVDLYGIAELNGVFARQHFVGTRREPLVIQGDPVDHILARHKALGVNQVIWNLGRSYVDFHADHPLVTRWGQLTMERGLADQMTPSQARHMADFGRRDPLARAIDVAGELTMPIWGWLCMNRFYPHNPPMTNQTHFWCEHREEMAEYHKDGVRDESRLCYAFPEYRQERLAAISEAARIEGPRSGQGVQIIVLDFCRQPPMLMYHPRLCDEYQREAGDDPRQILAVDLGRFTPWVRWRADILTRFVREAHAELDRVGAELGRRVGLAVRITDQGPHINLLEGVDIEAYCREGVIDAIVTSPLNWIRTVLRHDLRPYVALGRRYGIRAIAGVCLNQLTRFHGIPGSTSGVSLARRAHECQSQGADGIAFYQSESGLEFDDFDQFVPAFADPAATEALLADEAFLRRWPDTHLNDTYGLDCHSWFNDYTIDGRINFGGVDWRGEGFTLDRSGKQV